MRRLEIESIAAGGDGVARADGLVVFVPRTAPGDVIEAEVVQKGRAARATLARLLEPSSLRVEPPCAHYVKDRCGGCQLQHLRYDAQLEAKSRIVRDALQRIGKRAVALPVTRPSPSPWRYRRKLTLAMRRHPRGWIAGLHPYDAPARVFRLVECPITAERVLALWREVLEAADELPREAMLRGAVRLDGDRASFTLEGGVTWPTSERFFERTPSLDALWWIPDGAARRQRHRRTEGGAPGASFAQVNEGVAAELRAHIVERALSHTPRVVIDAYAGSGDTSAALARPGLRVTAIELDTDAAAYAASRLGMEARVLAARVEDVLPAELPADVVVLNPPRTGVDARVTATLDAAAPAVRAVIYVSCDPATLARDLTRMPRWRVASVTAFDMFPQTAHVETVCVLVPEAA